VRLVRRVTGGSLAWLEGDTEEQLLEDTHMLGYKGQVTGAGDQDAIHWLAGGNARDTLSG